jgi:1-deoxy-D-xylulose-5-phosphate synthase
MAALLDNINAPADLRNLSVAELEDLAAEIRARIISTVSRTGGHLAANLGVVEMTIALLRIFNPPADRIVWDVSHQGYTYKLLTGRKDRFDTLRQFGGLSGFLKRDESPCDAFGAGHSGTAVSAALGMAVARDRRGGPEHVVAILGDGSAGCGISFEGLNHVATTTKRLVLILNDNEMSIARNVGAMARYMGGLLASPRYNRWKRSVETLATRLKMSAFRTAYYRIEEAIKSVFLRSVIFEELGLRYIGPIDGHSLHALLDALAIARDSDRPILLHVSTEKGKGYSFAEEQPEKWHGAPKFDIMSGEPIAPPDRPTYSTIVGAALQRLAEQDQSIVAVTAGMAAGTGLSEFARRFPDRFFDVGISEEHAVIFAAGMAAEGLKPVFAVYSTFLQRGVDCVIHDVCLQNLPVVLCLDRAGIVGDDGPTHHGVFDIPLLRPVPGLIIMQPKDEAELANMLFTAFRLGKPVVIRYPRGAGSGAPLPSQFQELPLGQAEILRPGSGLQIWALGDMIPLANEVADLLAREQGAKAGVVNARFIRPLDEAMLAKQAPDTKLFVTLENGNVAGGFGSGVEEALRKNGFGGRVLKFGWPDEFIPHGSQESLMNAYGLTPRAIAAAIRKAGL